MLITVDEARQLKKNSLFWMGKQGEEYGKFSGIVNLFTVWFMVLTLVRSLVVATVIAAMVTQEPDIGAAWENGSGFGFFIGYFLLSCIPAIGNFVVILAPIGVVITAFAVGEGIGYNFPTFVLPLILAYVVTFGLIFLSNAIFNSIIKGACPEVYEALGGSITDDAVNERSTNDETNKTRPADDMHEEGRDKSDEYYDDTF